MQMNLRFVSIQNVTLLFAASLEAAAQAWMLQGTYQLCLAYWRVNGGRQTETVSLPLRILIVWISHVADQSYIFHTQTHSPETLCLSCYLASVRSGRSPALALPLSMFWWKPVIISQLDMYTGTSKDYYNLIAQCSSKNDVSMTSEWYDFIICKLMISWHFFPPFSEIYHQD